MPKNSLILNPDEIEMVYNSIENFIEEKHKFCYIKDIMDDTKLPKQKCKKILKHLIKRDRIIIIFEGKGFPKIYIPKYMFEGILQSQHKPKWLKKYIFHEKSKNVKEIEKLRKEVNHYEIIERLLYSTAKPLEVAVKYCLDLLGLEEVTLIDDNNKHDISFSHNGKKYILEVKGLTKHGTKDNINQLDGWIKQELAIESNENELVGVFVLNHYRNKDPKERGDQLTNTAKKFLNYYKFKFFTTPFLFNIMKEVEQNKLNKEDAITKIIEGEKYK